MMVRASALYSSLIVSILILLVCGSLLLIGFTYQLQERKLERMSLLELNTHSAILVLLHEDFKKDSVQRMSLFGTGNDSVLLEKRQWGAYELGLLRSYRAKDTVYKSFLIGSLLSDTGKVLYLTDEDRPVSIVGNSKIKGTAYLPKSGIKPAYVEGNGYADKTLVYGAVKDSQRNMPAIDAAVLKGLEDLRHSDAIEVRLLPDSINQSFFHPVKRIHLSGSVALLQGFKARGNVIISSDSLIEVDAGAALSRVILIAPQVRIAGHFKGDIQVIASDSVVVGDSVHLTYPSGLFVLKNDTTKFQASIRIGKNALVEGQLFAYEKERTLLMPIISMGAGVVIKGEIWCKGYVALSKTARVEGSVSAIRLMAKISSAIYENYLIDVALDKSRLSKYYLSTTLINNTNKRGRLLCWVN